MIAQPISRHHKRPLQIGLGMTLGLVGVALFSLTLPLNRIAVQSMDPIWIAASRTEIAAILAALILWLTKTPRPPRQLWLPLTLCGLGVVFGFPFFTSLAMAQTSASHGAIVVALLPIATAIAGAGIAREKPSRGFWIASITGALIVSAWTLQSSGWALSNADIYLFIAVAMGGMGYAAGGQVAKVIGGWQTICWVVLFSAPLVLPVVIATTDVESLKIAPTYAWLALAWLGVFSQLIGFFFWYGGMAIAGIAKTAQVQLLQLFMTLLFAQAFLAEIVSADTWFVAAAVILVILAVRRSSVQHVE